MSNSLRELLEEARAEEKSRIFKGIIERAVTNGKGEDEVYEMLTSDMCLSDNEAMQLLSKYYKV